MQVTILIKIHNGTLDLLMTDLYISVNIIPDTKFQIPMICVTFSIEDFKNGLSIFDLAIKKGLEVLSNSQKGCVAKQLCKDTELIIEKIMEITGENTIENILQYFLKGASLCVGQRFSDILRENLIYGNI